MSSFIELLLKDSNVYPGYPGFRERVAISDASYEDWVKNGRPSGLVGGLYNHPNYLKGVQKKIAIEDDGTQQFLDTEFMSSCTGPYLRDSNGRPVHPYAEDILKAGLGVEGPGFYWGYGPQRCADTLVVGVSKDGRLKIIVIERGDTGRIALPGGHLNGDENPWLAAVREFCEETTIEIFQDNLLYFERLLRDIVPDTRTTLNAWPETTVFLFVLKDGVIDTYQPVGSDDAARALCVPVDDALFEKIQPAHEEFVRRAVEVFEEQFEVLVCTDGSVDANQG